MPLPTDAELVKTSQDILTQLQAIFGKHPGFRPAHAKGILLTGDFSPTATAAALSVGPQFFEIASLPVTVRFSNSTGIPQIPDTDANAEPRGIAIRFHLGGREHTDIVAHSTPFFPTRTGAEFLAFLRAVAAGEIEAFAASHPATRAFLQAPKPAPSSYAREAYFGVTAFKLVDAGGKGTFVRYLIEPVLGVEMLDAAALAERGPDYLLEELRERVGKEPVIFKLRAQVAAEGDVVDDATVHWPKEREVVELGTLVFDTVEEENEKQQKHIIFDPIPRVPGVEASDDPLLELRAAVYLLSGRERRAA